MGCVRPVLPKLNFTLQLPYSPSTFFFFFSPLLSPVPPHHLPLLSDFLVTRSKAKEWNFAPHPHLCFFLELRTVADSLRERLVVPLLFRLLCRF